MIELYGKNSYKYIASDNCKVYTVTRYNRYKYSGCDRVIEGPGYKTKHIVYHRCDFVSLNPVDGVQ